MELPTYTNIWKIEKRLYKLYDFRLPMPLPVGQITVFIAIAVPYIMVLTLAGMPFSHTWVWLYALPPGVLAWLVTRPVLEGKRLPELVLSQLRYLAEPRTWCRMMPAAEKDHVLVVAQVWRVPAGRPRAGPVSEAHPVSEPASASAPAARSGQPASSQPGAAGTVGSAAGATAHAADAGGSPGGTRASSGTEVRPPVAQRLPTGSAVVTVHAGSAAQPLVRVSVSAQRGSPGDSRTSRRDRVVVVPGGLRPGPLDRAERDRARARLPLPGPARIVVLGTTAGAGQTVTALLAAQLLASLRDEAVAVLDLSSGPGSVTELARQIPRLLPGRRPGTGARPAGRNGAARDRALQVVTAEHAGSQPRDASQVIDAVCARYPLTIADPTAADVPRALQAADQLVLVSPAGADAAGSLAMTMEWLEAHGHGRLVQASVAVVNGVSVQTAAHAERAAAVAVGRCRAVVRVPWDARLPDGGALGAEYVRAIVALAGLLISGLAERGPAAVQAVRAPLAGSAPAGRPVSR